MLPQRAVSPGKGKDAAGPREAVDLAEAGIEVGEPAEDLQGEGASERGIGGETDRGRWKIAGFGEGLAVAVRIGAEARR